MKSILVSSRRVLALSLVAAALAFVPASAHATISPKPTYPPTAVGVDLSLTIDLALAAYGL